MSPAQIVSYLLMLAAVSVLATLAGMVANAGSLPADQFWPALALLALTLLILLFLIVLFRCLHRGLLDKRAFKRAVIAAFQKLEQARD